MAMNNTSGYIESELIYLKYVVLLMTRVFVYTPELSVNKWSTASVVGFEVDGVRRSGWGLQQGFVLS